MKVTLERLPESRVQLDIEIDQDRLEHSLQSAYRRVAAKARIPGFRPGKAPRHIVERRVGREGLIREALDDLVPDTYNAAIAEHDVDAIAQPDLEILELEPVRFKATVAVRPTVTLNDYRSVRVEKEEQAVTGEAVDEQVLLLRRRHATQVPVERPAQWDDILSATVKGTVEGDEFVDDEDAEFQLLEGQVLLLPGLGEAFPGMSRGESKHIELEIPEDFRVERLRGKTAELDINVLEVKEQQLPDEDDELAALLNNDEIDSLATLRQRIQEDLQKAMDDEAQAKFRDEALAKVVEVATIDFPRVLVEREIDHIIRETTGEDRQQYIAYLGHIGRTEAEFRETFRETAEGRVRRTLVLGQLTEDEGIEVSAEDIEEELERITAPMGEDAPKFRELFSSESGRDTIERDLRGRKTLERLDAIASGTAPEKPPTPAADGETNEEAGPDTAPAAAQEENA